MQPMLTPGDWDPDAPITCVTIGPHSPQALVVPQLPQVFAGPGHVQLMAPLGGVERPRRMVRFARLIHRRGRVLGGPSARAASGGNPIPPASPPRVVCSAPCWCPPTGMPAMERERRRRHTTHLDLGRAAGEPGARRTALRLLRQLHRGRQRVGRVDRLAAQDRRLHSDDPSLALPARDELRRPDAPGPRHVPTDRRGHPPGLPGPNPPMAATNGPPPSPTTTRPAPACCWSWSSRSPCLGCSVPGSIST